MKETEKNANGQPVKRKMNVRRAKSSQVQICV